MRIARVAVALASVTLPVLMVHGHGSMKDPVSRVYSIYLEGPENPKSAAAQAAIATCGTQPFYDWHELVNFFPGDAAYQHDVPYHQEIPDGRIASADNVKYDCLDMIRSDWPATQVQPGPRELVWYATTPHDPNVFRVWLTTSDWEPESPLNWAQMEELEIGPVSFEGQDYRFETVLPEREGRHVLYVIWQRLDPIGEGFYAACDVIFGDDNAIPTGACCFDDGCSLLSDADCLASGGTWQGQNILCSQSECGQIGQGPDSVSVHELNSWIGGYEAMMTVTNSIGDLPMPSWDLVYESGPDITAIWNASMEQVNGETVISSEPWNGYLAPGESATFGFVADGAWPPTFAHARLNGFHVHVEGGGDSHPACPGDVDGNMSVDVEDLLRILNAWGTGDGEYDLDGDLVVGVNDLLIVIGDWGPCD